MNGFDRDRPPAPPAGPRASDSDFGARRRRWLAAARLTLVTGAAHGAAGSDELVRVALQNGVNVVRLREKELSASEIVRAARVIRRLCDAYDALLIVNDRPDLALVCGADGVHVGQHDAAPAQVRRFVGDDLLIGQTVHTPAQAGAASADPAVDYLAVDADSGELLEHVALTIDKPVFAQDAHGRPAVGCTRGLTGRICVDDVTLLLAGADAAKELRRLRELTGTARIAGAAIAPAEVPA